MSVPTSLRGDDMVVTPRKAEVVALALVDEAIRNVSRRQCVPRSEALGLLGRVLGGIESAVASARAASVVEDAANSYDGALLVARAGIADALLDLRLVLAS